MQVHEIYLNEFYNKPNTLEDYKVNYLKNHYYPSINKILNIEFKDFQIGVSKNKDLIWFANKTNPNFEVIYNHKKNIYLINKNKSTNPEIINIEDYNDKYDNNKYDNIKIKIEPVNTCIMGCNIF